MAALPLQLLAVTCSNTSVCEHAQPLITLSKPPSEDVPLSRVPEALELYQEYVQSCDYDDSVADKGSSRAISQMFASDRQVHTLTAEAQMADVAISKLTRSQSRAAMAAILAERSQIIHMIRNIVATTNASGGRCLAFIKAPRF